jgi:SAM-dependent methyltransferase
VTIKAKPWKSIDGYVSDLAYPSSLHKSFQPPWTDWQLERRSLAAPRRKSEPFTLVDLGCGDALGLITAAASHTQGTFIGVDAMRAHIGRGEAIVRQAQLENVRLHCAEFRNAMPLADGRADYVTAQGVLAWINPENRDFLADLAVGWLRPGGVLTIGYNSLPGWHRIAPFQKLVRELAMSLTGSSVTRFFGAVEQIQQMNVFGQDLWDWLEPAIDRHAPEYFAHEYLNEWWSPLWSADVMRAFASRGLVYVGQAMHHGLRADLNIPAATRKALESIQDPIARELAKDVTVNTWYRQDIYIKSPIDVVDPVTSQTSMLARWWLLTESPSDDNFYSTVTLAGKLDFDTPCARAIVERLMRGPAPLSAIKGFEPSDLINSMDALFTAQRCLPVDPPGPTLAAKRLNGLLRAQGEPLRMYASSHGAFSIELCESTEMDAQDRLRLGLDAV